MAAPAPTIMMPDHGSCHADMMLTNKIADTRADVLGAGAANTQTILTDANNNVSTLLQEGCGQTASIIATTERQNYALGSQADRIAHAGGAQVERNFAETRGILNGNFSASLLAAKDGEIATHKGIGDLKHLICETGGKVSADVIAGREALAGLIGREALQSQLQAANNFGAIQLEASKNIAAIQLESAKNFASQRLETDKQFALASLAAAQNKESLALQIAECCCEVKAAVNSTANATQALIQSTESSRIRDALAAATNENLILRLGGVAAVAR